MPRFPAANENAAVAAAIVPGTTYYLSLHTADTGTTGANEVSGGSYARKSIVFSTASGGVLTSTTAQSFTSMPSVPTGCPYFGVWSAATGGTFQCGGTTSALSSSIPAGATVAFAIGGVTVAAA